MRKKLHSKTREAPRRAVRTMAATNERRAAMSKENPTDAKRWCVVESRDASHDGEFVYGVMTTGVYCRPSCGSRLPLRKSVRFFTTIDDAEQAGLRPCKRCRPKGASAVLLNQVIHELARQIDARPEQ